MQDITLFTSTPKAQFYDKLFENLDLSCFPDNTAKTGRKGFSQRAKLRAFIVMKCKCFSCITDLLDYLQNNLIIAHYCGFDILKPLPSYWTFDRFINNLDNQYLKDLMKSQVLHLAETGIIDTSFIALDSTPVYANTSRNNPKKLSSGHPICETGLAMNKDGKFSDNGRTRQKYCCPFRQSKTSSCPCNHKNWNNEKKNRGCTKYVILPDDYRLSIDRECISFKKIYALRTKAERYSARFKQMEQEHLWVRSLNAAQNLNTVVVFYFWCFAHL